MATKKITIKAPTLGEKHDAGGQLAKGHPSGARVAVEAKIAKGPAKKASPPKKALPKKVAELDLRRGVYLPRNQAYV